MTAPFPRFDDLTNDRDAVRIAARTGLPLADIRRALDRLADDRHRAVVAARTGIEVAERPRAGRVPARMRSAEDERPRARTFTTGG